MTIKDFGGKSCECLGRTPTCYKTDARRGNETRQPNPKTTNFSYDAHADWEVSRLLSALDEQSKKAEIRRDAAKLSEINQLADTCVRILESQSASAEVFIQLAQRAIKDNDYDRLDKLGDHLSVRYSAGEIAEVIRQTDVPQIRAIAFETLAMMPIPAILPLLDDPLYSGIAAATIEQKAFEFESEEARDILEQLDVDGPVTDQ